MQLAGKLIHRIRVYALPDQTAVLLITLQQSVPFQETADEPRNRLRQVGEFGVRRGLDLLIIGRHPGFGT